MFVLVNTILGYNSIVGVFKTSSEENLMKMISFHLDWNEVPTKETLRKSCYEIHDDLSFISESSHEECLKSELSLCSEKEVIDHFSQFSLKGV